MEEDKQQVQKCQKIYGQLNRLKLELQQQIVEIDRLSNHKLDYRRISKYQKEKEADNKDKDKDKNSRLEEQIDYKLDRVMRQAEDMIHQVQNENTGQIKSVRQNEQYLQQQIHKQQQQQRLLQSKKMRVHSTSKQKQQSYQHRNSSIKESSNPIILKPNRQSNILPKQSATIDISNTTNDNKTINQKEQLQPIQRANQQIKVWKKQKLLEYLEGNDKEGFNGTVLVQYRKLKNEIMMIQKKLKQHQQKHSQKYKQLFLKNLYEHQKQKEPIVLEIQSQEEKEELGIRGVEVGIKDSDVRSVGRLKSVDRAILKYEQNISDDNKYKMMLMKIVQIGDNKVEEYDRYGIKYFFVVWNYIQYLQNDIQEISEGYQGSVKSSHRIGQYLYQLFSRLLVGNGCQKDRDRDRQSVNIKEQFQKVKKEYEEQKQQNMIRKVEGLLRNKELQCLKENRRCMLVVKNVFQEYFGKSQMFYDYSNFNS